MTSRLVLILSQRWFLLPNGSCSKLVLFSENVPEVDPFTEMFPEVDPFSEMFPEVAPDPEVVPDPELVPDSKVVPNVNVPVHASLVP